MAADARISELLTAWEEAQARGENRSVEALCAACPELVEPLRKRIHILQAMAPILDLAPFRSEGLEETRQAGQTVSAAPRTPVAMPRDAIPGYEIQGELGRGGAGVVYQARQIGLDRLVAVKMILAGPSAGDVALARFQAEARTVARLDHPNIVEIYDCGIHQDYPYFVLEFMENGNLGAFLDGRRMPADHAARLLEILASTIHVAHVEGIIHRDLKPANVLLKGARARGSPAGEGADFDIGTPKIADFGLALDVGGGKRLTRTGTIMGTPCYMAPEQASGKHELIGPATDVYSLGVILYELLTGALPFDATTDWEILNQVVHKIPEAPRQRQGDCPPALEAICLRCLQKQPADRYGSAKDLADDLARFRAGQPLRAIPSATLKIGLIFSLSGPTAINSEPVVDLIHWALQELNDQGGLLGRRVQPVTVDCRFDEGVFAREAERLIVEEKVSTLLGCWSSANRKAVLPIVEKHQHLLLYPVEFEGLERSNHVVYLGGVPNQLVIPAVRWAHAELGKRRFLLIGSSSVFSHAVHAIIKDELKTLTGAWLAGEEYLQRDPGWFATLGALIEAAQPDVIVNTISGDGNIAFYRSLLEAGITASALPTLALDFTEQELRSLSLTEMAGNYLVSSYFQSLERPENHRFLERLFTKVGRHRVITDAMEAAFAGLQLWVQAVGAAGTDEPRAIRAALSQERVDGPGGLLRIDAGSGYAHKFGRIGRIEADGSLRLVWSSQEPVAPEPYPSSRTVTEWELFLMHLHQAWGNRWAHP
ncbi:MAG: transporter substrate-binding protein [Planctomycetes bacterium]|nr:transporter substrate-binding protein [Planctomycetota bacterium]